MKVLVDTDVVSYLLNRHSFAKAYEKLLIGHTPMISFITVAELYYGALKRGWGQKRIDELEAHLHQFAVVPYSLDVCIAYARIRIKAEAKGRPVPMADAFIAACAVSLGIPLMTHNKRHFEKWMDWA